MGRSWDISGDDIDMWASRIDARATLPELMRRLLHATTELRQLDMPAGAGVGARGWDGVVEALRGHVFCPEGMSVWELSTSRDAWGKLNEDLHKREAAESIFDPRATTYVAVSARRLDRKRRDRWLAAQRTQAHWRQVAVLDADNLAEWLASAPAVARWFAGVLGRPTTEIRDIESFLDEWSRRTERRLPWCYRAASLMAVSAG